ncbi:hypothetical protein CBM2599_B50929 [Cupriavidus taiwanensis]|nr:hypothetical protein CBM2600_B10059 [Cupriavidus taiwanensis]SOY97183.1 hypothetical protein CBM2599_B50929 [Cupriavidus taiwanensis]
MRQDFDDDAYARLWLFAHQSAPADPSWHVFGQTGALAVAQRQGVDHEFNDAGEYRRGDHR